MEACSSSYSWCGKGRYPLCNPASLCMFQVLLSYFICQGLLKVTVTHPILLRVSKDAHVSRDTLTNTQTYTITCFCMQCACRHLCYFVIIHSSDIASCQIAELTWWTEERHFLSSFHLQAFKHIITLRCLGFIQRSTAFLKGDCSEASIIKKILR